MLALLKLGFPRPQKRTWSRGFIKRERTKRHLKWVVNRRELAGSVWGRTTKGTRSRRSSVAICAGVEGEACSWLLLRCFATASTRELWAVFVLLSSFALLRVISPAKKKLDEGICSFPCFACCCIQKTTHLSDIFFLATRAKTIPNKKAINGLKWRHKLRLYPDFFNKLCCSVVFWKSALFTIFKNS